MGDEVVSNYNKLVGPVWERTPLSRPFLWAAENEPTTRALREEVTPPRAFGHPLPRNTGTKPKRPLKAPPLDTGTPGERPKTPGEEPPARRALFRTPPGPGSTIQEAADLLLSPGGHGEPQPRHEPRGEPEKTAAGTEPPTERAKAPETAPVSAFPAQRHYEPRPQEAAHDGSAAPRSTSTPALGHRGRSH